MAQAQVGFWAAIIVMLLGLVGAVLPGIPGVALIWGAALVYAIAERFVTITPVTMVILSLLALAGGSADIWLSAVSGQKLGGASRAALLAGMICGLIGLVVGFLFAGVGAIPGALIGTMAGIVIVEYRRQRRVAGAARAAAGWFAGYLVSSLVELLAGIGMIALFVWRATAGG